MKHRYSGNHMRIYGSILPGAASIARYGFVIDKLTQDAKQRLKVVGWHNSHNSNCSLTARHFGISRNTVSRWSTQHKVGGAIALNERSRRPHRLRRPTTSHNVIVLIIGVRKEFPTWSKHKISAYLKWNHQILVSPSTVGRVLKRKNLINRKSSVKRIRAALRPKARFPKGMIISKPGQMIQIDTKYIVVCGGRTFFQFTAIDVLTKQRILRVYPSQSSRNGAKFLTDCRKGFPFKIINVQTDNGAPFLKHFEKACKKYRYQHYFIEPHQPKQNTFVERSHEADEFEFYRQGKKSMLLPVMRQRMREWQDVWNNRRPHEALGQLTPKMYFERLNEITLATKDYIILQS
ncbi:transposase [Candidatus Falkowbacteria bacterium]|nr:transposase [Candidatus Falkowbacteria bacterium]